MNIDDFDEEEDSMMQKVSTIFKRFFLVCVVLSSVISIASSQESKKPAFKGMELYSYLDQQNNLRYALLLGTNRLKDVKEIIDSGIDFETLLKNIEQCASGEQIFWSNHLMSTENKDIQFVYPEKSIIEKIKSFCQEHRIQLILGDEVNQ